MRKDFCVFILTHGRPGKVKTYQTLKRSGYTGQIFIVIDDDDETGEEYKEIFGESVLVFSKDKIAKYTDAFDNSTDRRGVLWARNVCWDLAREKGYRFFVQLDDDYYVFHYRKVGRGHQNSNSAREEFHGWIIKNLDIVFSALVRLIETTPVDTIAFSQGGDHMGGELHKKLFRRKAMNSFFCDVEKPFMFRGRLNDDVNTYVSLGNIGRLFFTDMELQLEQDQTQENAGGMSEAYRDSGTYVKSFYTVMAAPSCTTINLMGRFNKRLHHKINWDKAVPKILRQ
tara:strand:- start:391 stop:1242 length:852 start_codon:yes stop_codon:yes gene_type:complete